MSHSGNAQGLLSGDMVTGTQRGRRIADSRGHRRHACPLVTDTTTRWVIAALDTFGSGEGDTGKGRENSKAISSELIL